MNAKKKPTFIRRDWYKRKKLGKTVKKKRNWRAAKGRQNKIRLSVKGYAKAPSPGYGADKKTRRQINGVNVIRVENIKQMEKIEKRFGIIIGKIGKKKREEILKIAAEKGIDVLNKYKEKKNATG